MNKVGPDGVTLKATLESVKRQTGITPEELKGPKFPFLMDNVWSAFKRLSNRRSPSFSGVGPITYEQILAWKKLTQTHLSPREIAAIEELDNEYLKVMND